MAGRSRAPGSEQHIDADVVRSQLERIVQSGVFRRSTRLTNFLEYVVEQSLSGHGSGIKEQLIALDVYGLGSDFDPGRDPIVRVDARRLRDKLREYYAEFPTER